MSDTELAKTAKSVAGPKPIAGAAEAPILHFEAAVGHGIAPDGTCKIVLVGTYQDFVDGQLVAIPRVVAHLRGSPGALASLRDQINSIELALTKPQGQAN